MSWLSKALGGVGHAIGSVASNPITQGLSGLGGSALGGAVTGAMGGLLKPGGGIGSVASGAGKGALIGGGTGMAAGALGLGGAALAPALGSIGGAGGLTGALGTAGSFLKDHAGSLVNGAESALGLGGAGGGGGMSPAILALLAAQGINTAQLGAKANQYADNAMNSVNDSYNARAGLRSQGIAGLSQARPMQSLSGLTAIRQQNPVVGRALPVAGG